MELIDIKLTFTESNDYDLKRKDYFHSKSLEEKVAILNQSNRRARRNKGGSYDKTDLILIMEDGSEVPMRYDLGSEIGVVERISKNLGTSVTLHDGASPFTYSVEYHYNTEGGMGCEVYAEDLKTFGRAKAVLREACEKDPVDSWWGNRPNMKEWAIIIKMKKYTLPESEEDDEETD